jgi:hypothetical protein
VLTKKPECLSALEEHHWWVTWGTNQPLEKNHGGKKEMPVL